MFQGKTLMITGGTGSFGNAVLNRFLQTDIGEIRIFSRDEKKQDDMRHEFQAKMPDAAEKIKFFIGDVRDLSSVKNAMYGVDYIYVSDYERADFDVDVAALDAAYPVVYENADVTIYAVTQ